MVVKQPLDYCQKLLTSRCFFEQQNCWLKIRFVGKIKPKNPLKVWWIPGRKRICLNKENAQRGRLQRKTNKIVNFPLERLPQPCKFFLPNPPPLLQNRFFIFSISLLNSIFDFNLFASFAQIFISS